MGNSCCGAPDPFGEDSSPGTQYRKRKMNYSRPTEFTKGVSIRKNPETGLYEGVPKEWVEQNDIDLGADTSKTVATSHFSDSIRPVPVLPPKILRMIDSYPVTQSSILPSVRSAQPQITSTNRQPNSYPVRHFGR